MSLKSTLRAWGAKPVGFLVLSVLIAALSGLALGALLIPVGAIILLAIAFGLPIYFGWNTDLRKFLTVALIVLLVGPLFTGFVTTSSVLSPSPAVSSSDGVLTNGQATPFQSTASHPDFTFQVQVNSTVDRKAGDWLRDVYVWITNCDSDTDVKSTQGKCILSPPDKFVNLTQAVTPAQANATQPFTLSFPEPSLPSGQVWYYMFLTAVSNVNISSIVDWAGNDHGAYSCTAPATYTSCTYNEGPVSATYAQVYVFLAPGDYISMVLVVAVLAAIIFVYIWLKGRERNRKAQAKAAAEGEEATPPAQELRCPHCNAVVEAGEKTCWKCKKDLSAPPEKKPLSSAPLRSGSAAASEGTIPPGSPSAETTPSETPSPGTDGPSDEPPSP